MDATTAAVIGIAGAIAGYSFRVVEGWLRARWDRDRDREARREAKRERLDDIQRTTLLEVQVLLGDWLDEALGTAIADSTAIRKTGGVTRAEVEKAVSPTSRRLGFLIERVREDELRIALEKLRSDTMWDQTVRTLRKGPQGADRVDAAIVERYQEAQAVQSQVGEVLRAYL